MVGSDHDTGCTNAVKNCPIIRPPKAIALPVTPLKAPVSDVLDVDPVGGGNDM